MGAYSKEIGKPMCARCRSRRASREVFNRFNASCGYFCAACVRQQISDLDRTVTYPTMNGKEIKPYPANQLRSAGEILLED